MFFIWFLFNIICIITGGFLIKEEPLAGGILIGIGIVFMIMWIYVYCKKRKNKRSNECGADTCVLDCPEDLFLVGKNKHLDCDCFDGDCGGV